MLVQFLQEELTVKAITFSRGFPVSHSLRNPHSCTMNYYLCTERGLVLEGSWPWDILMMSSFSAMMETEFWGPGSKSMLELRPGKERQWWQEEEEEKVCVWGGTGYIHESEGPGWGWVERWRSTEFDSGHWRQGGGWTELGWFNKPVMFLISFCLVKPGIHILQATLGLKIQGHNTRGFWLLGYGGQNFLTLWRSSHGKCLCLQLVQ